MASMNWLGFSLFPQQLPPHEEEEHSQTVVPCHGFNSEGVSGECFDLTSHSTSTPSSLNLPPSFGIFEETLNGSNTHAPREDWNIKGNYNGQSLLLETSCSNNQNLDNNNHQHQQQPKLENFLGQHSFGDHNHQTYGGNCSFQLPEKSAACGGDGSGGSYGGSPKITNSIGLSMIKSWLRSQPPQKHSSSDGAAAAASISLSMVSTVSQSSSSVALPLLGANVDGESSSSDNKLPPPITAALEGHAAGAINVESAMPRKSSDTFGQRTSIYRGVTRHRWTGRYEAHLWDNTCRREGQTRKGRQVYLGGYDKEEKAARSYDLAALKYWGTATTTNFPISHYEKELEEMKHMTRQEYVASLRRKSSGFSRGASIYRGVTRHHQHGRWQARIGRVSGNKDLYLGTFTTQEAAAEAYDVAAIKFRGLSAVTNFDMSRYDVKSILESSNLPIGGAELSKADNSVEQVDLSVDNVRQKSSSSEDHSMSSQLSYGPNNNHSALPSLPLFQQQPQPYSQMHSSYYPYGQKLWCKKEQDVDHASQTFEDIHQLQLGNTYNFFQPNSGLHSFVSTDSASMDNNNNTIYGGGDGNGYGGSWGYMIPMGTTNSTFIANDGNQNQRSSGFGDNDMKLLGYENVINSSHDPYHAKNMYYFSQQTSADAVKGGVYDACNTWVPSTIPTLAQRPSNIALCTGASPFTLLHE